MRKFAKNSQEIGYNGYTSFFEMGGTLATHFANLFAKSNFMEKQQANFSWDDISLLTELHPH